MIYIASKGFFKSFARTKPNFDLPRSASMRTPSPPPPSASSVKTISSASTSLTALSRDADAAVSRVDVKLIFLYRVVHRERKNLLLY